MTTKVNKTIMVNVPISTAYWQWTQFEEFPHFMGGVERVTRLSDDRLEWVAEIAGIHRRWEAKIVQQDMDRAVAWAAVEGAKNAGWVDFKEAGPSQTSIHLSLEYEPHGVLEFLGDKLHVVERQAESDLKKFKEYIEKQAPGTASPPATAATPAAAPETPIVDPATHVFDQTNGLVDLGGDSDETADSDTLSAAERKESEDRGEGFIPPMGGMPGQR
ncbi:SRPBCC family protein [Arthrobacter sp. 18067]|uniref:SRPBCC family protein n=1 Tax=Arthrobacter sp. 18067 TaxID=2681413 RepID=UPI001356CA29|nr:SRPBCC family protein [Arthrobacter sp. 18067]